MSPFEQNLEIRKAVIKVMKEGGYYQKIMDGDSELDRVKEFLIRMEKAQHGERLYKQHPTFLPIFPGLDNQPMRSSKGDPVADYLREATPAIKEDALRLRDRTLSFTGGIVTDGAWNIFPLWYMGVNLPFMSAHCPNLSRIAAEIPRCGMLHPFSEALLSWQDPHTHLAAHCSVDSLRLRYSVGIIVESDCSLRVGEVRKQWETGESIIFEDCFEHEAWNGDKSRLVFIIDTWHPDLTAIECEALLAGFRKKEVRHILYEYRMSEAMRPFLLNRFEIEEKEPLIQQYWEHEGELYVPKPKNWGIWGTTPVFT
ncbi:aspartyl/asparaginyl beta-hydroxylase domain-containing protein [Vibrio rhizosphaerae]|uniref:aspartyl/asparaginyl beta-hydroxylase domain-containing protein n=1 Tax=Vibrio rhizosphaerae TaxID=398736 RepID=UPI000572024E|nr:aspartyl/asparaginyl beta-hydroxylase domain-containing protein [Vibrio rhizosphaerae]